MDFALINFFQVPKYTRGHKILDKQNVGSEKMTTDSSFGFKKTDFNTILACLEGKVYGGGRGSYFFGRNRGDRSFIDAVFYR